MTKKTDDHPKDDGTKRVFRLETQNASFGYTDTGECIECMVMGSDLCSMHGNYNAAGVDEEKK